MLQMEFQSGGDEHGKLVWPQGEVRSTALADAGGSGSKSECHACCCKLFTPDAFCCRAVAGTPINTHFPELGQLLKLQPGHCDPTFNMYDWVVAYRGSRVEAVWPIAARGPGL